MTRPFLKFFVFLTVYSLIICSTGFIGLDRFLPGFALSLRSYTAICIFFYQVTLIIHYVLLKASKDSGNVFVRVTMITTFGKLFLTIIALVIFVLLNKASMVECFITFLFLYFFYLVFETILIYRFLRLLDYRRSKIATTKEAEKN